LFIYFLFRNLFSLFIFQLILLFGVYVYFFNTNLPFFYITSFFYF